MVLIGIAPLRTFGVLGEALSKQHADGLLIEVDFSVLTRRGLGFSELELAVLIVAILTLDPVAADLDDLLPDGDRAIRHVDVVPTQPHRAIWRRTSP